MLSASRTCALALCAIGVAGLAVAHADTIQVSISGNASGELGGRNFSHQTVTFTAQTSTDVVAACEDHAASGCYFQTDSSRHFLIPYTGGTVSIGGLGTYTVSGTELIDFLASTYDGDMIRLGVPGGAGGLTFGVTMPGISYNYNFNQALTWTGGPEGSFVDAECFSGPAAQCPYFANTNGGELRLTTLYPGVAGDLSLQPDATAVTPEPATWALVGSGLAAAVGSARRRRQQR